MCIPPVQLPWWLDRVGIPLIFTLVGALLGFTGGRLKDSMDAQRDKKSFLKAIAVEIAAIRNHLEGTLKDAIDIRELLKKGERRVLHLATNFQTGIYSSQLAKLKDVSDPILLDIIHFYDRIYNLERIKSRVTEVSFELTALTNPGHQQEEQIKINYLSSLDEVISRIKNLIPVSTDLINKLANNK